MKETQRIVFLGGDLRQSYMVQKLVANGYLVATYGLDIEEQYDLIYRASSLKSALNFGNIIVCPVPISHDKEHITSEQDYADLTVANLIKNLNSNHIFFGGVVLPCIREACKEKNIPCYDLMDLETVSIKNAIATAEGTIAEAIRQSTVNLHGSSCLVLGYGRCAKVLADKLKGLHAHTTVCARSEESLAYADSLGFQTLPLKDLSSSIHSYTFIFNTIPEQILKEPLIKLLNKNTIIIDIASKPGGTNFDACKQYGIRASLCLGLPGKYAPETSADILNSIVLSITNHTC
ncbi:dipicolinate synthase subunit DpsA [Anaerosporobacter faecicola]|uniref:dipicolinate synthase subunit DpsA n=1 Tax=Anaerosporobacter faecicola TaxID=2718714 RepID=UPI00143B966A|nr:dipicolinate synthase subunit DpsA [Anaerosporobacter faecicola]